MNNNDVLRRIRYIFDYGDDKMMNIFFKAEKHVTREQICDWLKRDDQPTFKKLRDVELSTFLNGLIHEKRGKKEGPAPVPEKNVSNNLILRKLKIALNFQAEDVPCCHGSRRAELKQARIECFFFESLHTSNYRECRDQVLRNFLTGLGKKLRNS